MSDAETLVSLIREVGVSRLGYFDGCICCRFSVRGVDVKVCCGKGSQRGVTVDSGSGSYSREDLQQVLDEVLSQLRDADGRGELTGCIDDDAPTREAVTP